MMKIHRGKLRTVDLCCSFCSSHDKIIRDILPQPIKQCSAAAAAKLLQLCPTLCDPIDGSLWVRLKAGEEGDNRR